jgi:Nif-specific regulatory protein
MTNHAQEERQMDLLFEVARSLTSSLDLKTTLESILALLSKLMKLHRGTVTLVDPETETLSIEMAHGLSEAARKRGIYRIGEGITGRVVATGETEVVPDVSKDPRFLDRTKARGDTRRIKLSFLCVPITLGKEILGALSVDKPFKQGTEFHEDLRLLNIVASIIAQALSLHGMMKRDREKLIRENIHLRHELSNRYEYHNIVTRSSRMREVLEMIEQVSGSNATVLVRGESGTGKELVAHAIHYGSSRASRRFVVVNCAALPADLLESELFGHEKGAFTGATRRKEGRFEWANGGTLFLDEIGDFPLSTQVKLLRVIQAREFERLGATSTIRVNVRIIAATNKNLEQDVAEGRFREDLYYRINVFPIFLPPLRERKEDIILLAEHFLRKFRKANLKDIRRISTPAIDMLMSYHWPGNIRELENCIERAVLVCNEGVIRAQHLPASLQTADASHTTYTGTLPEAVANVEREMILEALKSSKGHQGKAAKTLGVTERILGYKIKKYGISPRIYSAKAQKYTNV